VALLNDGLYGHSFLDGTIGISLLKSAIFPDPDADRGRHRFTYSLYPHAGDWREAQVVRRAYELNAPLVAYLPPGGAATAGDTGAARSFLTVSADHVVAETVKAADDGDGLIVRLYEAHNRRGPVTLTFDRPVHSAEETDLLERVHGQAECQGCTVRCTIRPYEIKTLRVRLEGAKVPL
jgi:alpha-mannosidase